MNVTTYPLIRFYIYQVKLIQHIIGYNHAYFVFGDGTFVPLINFLSYYVPFPQKTPVSHKVIEKRRRDRINRCLNELGKTVPMALAKQVGS